MAQSVGPTELTTFNHRVKLSCYTGGGGGEGGGERERERKRETERERESGPGAIVCKSRATHRALIACNMPCYVPCGTKGQLSY